MKKKIFICYRRDDSEGFAGRIFDRLGPHFPGRVFMDTASIPAGDDFVAKVNEVMRESFVALVIIGPRWLALGQDGIPRLRAPRDHVRLEIVEAFRNDVKIIPVLIQGTPIPRSVDLPRGTVPLSRLHAVEIRHSTFDQDCPRLIDRLSEMEPRAKRSLVQKILFDSPF